MVQFIREIHSTFVTSSGYHIGDSNLSSIHLWHFWPNIWANIFPILQTLSENISVILLLIIINSLLMKISIFSLSFIPYLAWKDSEFVFEIEWDLAYSSIHFHIWCIQIGLLPNLLTATERDQPHFEPRKNSILKLLHLVVALFRFSTRRILQDYLMALITLLCEQSIEFSLPNWKLFIKIHIWAIL